MLTRLFQKIKFLLSLPEMRLFWLFLIPLIIIAALSIAFIPTAYRPSIIGGFIILTAVLYLVVIRLAKTTFEVKLERNQIQTIISNLYDGIVAYDSNFTILIFNASAERVFGLKGSDVIGRVMTPDRLREPGLRLIIQVLFPALAPSVERSATPDTYPQEMHLSFEDPQLELKVITSKIIDPHGRLLGFFKVIHDETRERALLRSKTEFITVAAHQLRTPLAAINWIFQGLNSGSFGDIPPSVKEVVETGLKAANKLTRTVDDLLDVSKIEEGRFGYRFEETDVAELIEKVLEPYVAIAGEHKVKLYFDYTPIPNLTKIKLDPTRISLVLQVLLDNALKYNVEGGEIIVRLEKTSNNPYIQFSVKDTGIGIPEEDAKKLFTKFFRAQNVVKYETEGTGLGLYIAKNVISRHGGKIWAESTLNRGTTLFFTLPIDESLIPQKETMAGEY